MSSRLAVSVCWSFAVFAAPLVAAAAPATYQYTGLAFTAGVAGGPAACPQCSVHGSVTFSAPLAPNLTLFTDVTGMVLSFSFADDEPSTPPGYGTGPLTNANAAVTTFGVTTDAAGGLKTWNLEVHRNDQLAWIATVSTTAAGDVGASQFGNGYDGFSFQAGSWTNPSAAAVPALPRGVPYALAALLLVAGVFGRRARSAAGLRR